MKALTIFIYMKDKTIYLNLKRFDIPKSLGGVNDLANAENYSKEIVNFLDTLDTFSYCVFFQESNLLEAIKTSKKTRIGCQSVHYDDVEIGKNFGAFTTLRTAKSMEAIGIKDTIIGHCEERKNLEYLTSLGGDKADINVILNKEIKCAINAGMNVLYCIGEKDIEQDKKYEVLRHQLIVGLKDVDLSKVTIAYEPVWAIGPEKVPPDEKYIKDIASFIKSVVNCKVVYGGGLKVENAKIIASIDELDGGLIALTRFGKDFGFYLDDFKKIVDTYKEGLN